MCFTQGLKFAVDGICGFTENIYGCRFTAAVIYSEGKMDNIFSRTISLIGGKGFEKLQNAHIVLCGCGGVGSFALEALVRSGVGKITVIDKDTVAGSNLNRQLIATVDTIGQYKAEVAKTRALSINAALEFNAVTEFITPQNVQSLIAPDADYIIDAIDDVRAKVAIAAYASKLKIPVICCLGTGNRLDGNKFEICDIYKTSGCPLARKMRCELKKAGVDFLEVLFSKARIVEPDFRLTDGKATVGSVAFVPSVAGLLIAQHVILKLMEETY